MSIQIMINTINGLLEIAEIAMPETFYATDSRVKAAKEMIKWLETQTGAKE